MKKEIFVVRFEISYFSHYQKDKEKMARSKDNAKEAILHLFLRKAEVSTKRLPLMTQANSYQQIHLKNAV